MDSALARLGRRRREVRTVLNIGASDGRCRQGWRDITSPLRTTCVSRLRLSQ